MSRQGSRTPGLEYPCGPIPTPGESRQVSQRIHWIRLPLPFALDHVNCWLLGEPGSQTLVDTGVASPSTRQLWQQYWGGKGTDGLSATPEQLLVTHFHPDHAGLASWFHEAGATLYGSAVETGMSRLLCSIDDSAYGEFQAHWYRTHGLPADRVETARGNANTYRKLVQPPPPGPAWTWLEEGQSITLGGDEYRVMIGRGHAPDMLMLYRPADHILVAADQILPTITPNVSVMPRLDDPDPLRSFLQTLYSLKHLPEDTLVLPSHGEPFRGLHARIEALESHHEQRLADVLVACSAQSLCAHDLFSLLFRRELDAQQMSFALGESLAHLHHLEARGVVTRQTAEDDGVTRFTSK